MSSIAAVRIPFLLLALVVGLAAPTLEGAHADGYGNLEVRVTPTVPAQILVDGVARNRTAISGLPLPAGQHRVCFGAVAGYLAPACQTVTVHTGQTTKTTGSYQRSGWLHVRTQPHQAAAPIIIDGVQRDAGEVLLPLSVGDHQVCFGEVTGRPTPACTTVRASADETSRLVGRYGGPETPSDPCPPGVPKARFIDTRTTAHRDAIDCLAWWGISKGATANTFAPNLAVTRGQIASFLHRLLEETDLLPAEKPRPAFTDVPPGHAHVRGIGTLASLDVIRGVGGGRYAPGDRLTRGQMASLLVRLHEQIVGRPVIAAPTTFRDATGTVHGDNIRKLVSLDVAHGYSDDTFRPGSQVTRAQMATFLTRYLSYLIDEELVAARTP